MCVAVRDLSHEPDQEPGEDVAVERPGPRRRRWLTDEEGDVLRERVLAARTPDDEDEDEEFFDDEGEDDSDGDGDEEDLDEEDEDPAEDEGDDEDY